MSVQNLAWTSYKFLAYSKFVRIRGWKWYSNDFFLTEGIHGINVIETKLPLNFLVRCATEHVTLSSFMSKLMFFDLLTICLNSS